ncbi:hypothetical protein KY290_022162 [Solanum tuberosum]|uniref:PGG domain-containing protein n=1 Tax=Solanum tuberosum TaxID=4113 RepID=A0ABQ7V3L1_SOLTU|nr:hypothetical protein KY290_022162 [Solanum tuberosum]
MFQYVVEKISARDVWLELEKICCHNSLDNFQDDDTLAIQDKFGETPLHYAARFGNLDAAKILVTRKSNLPHIVSNNGMYPIHVAAEYGYKNVDLVHYFFSVTKYSAPYTDRSGAMLLHRLICSGLYDFAMQLVKLYPDLAKYSSHRSSPLAQLATKTFGTSSVSYSKTQSSSELEYIRDKKWKHQNAIKFAECLCEGLQNISEKEINSIVGGPLLQAVRFDNYKLVEIIVTKFPSLIYYHHKNGKNILHVAVENRSKNVFKLVSQMNQHSHHLVTSIDSSNNTMLHLAGKLSEEKELKKTFGAALNMQEELRWFEDLKREKITVKDLDPPKKAVKQILPPSYYQHLNNNGKTAHQVFTEQHSNLRIQGEKWMKDTSSLCAIIATLIVTIAFAASITFPEIKNCENAFSISFKKGFFIAFIFSNTHFNIGEVR